MTKILIGCEESQTVCIAFRELGFESYSCDLLPCSGGHPEWHYQASIFDVIGLHDWDLAIFHPPCTYLTVTGNKWMKPEFKDRFPTRQQDRLDAIDFFKKLASLDIPHIAIENPVGIMSTVYRKTDQYVHPFHFGDPHSKRTGLWLKNLPKLVPTEIVEPEMYTYKDGRKDPMWHVESMKMPPAERQRYRSKTFPGIAKQMAKQWGDYLLNQLS